MGNLRGLKLCSPCDKGLWALRPTLRSPCDVLVGSAAGERWLITFGLFHARTMPFRARQLDERENQTRHRGRLKFLGSPPFLCGVGLTTLLTPHGLGSSASSMPALSCITTIFTLLRSRCRLPCLALLFWVEVMCPDMVRLMLNKAGLKVVREGEHDPSNSYYNRRAQRVRRCKDAFSRVWVCPCVLQVLWREDVKCPHGVWRVSLFSSTMSGRAPLPKRDGVVEGILCVLF